MGIRGQTGNPVSVLVASQLGLGSAGYFQHLGWTRSRNSGAGGQKDRGLRTVTGDEIGQVERGDGTVDAEQERGGV